MLDEPAQAESGHRQPDLEQRGQRVPQKTVWSHKLYYISILNANIDSNIIAIK
jgi:hypothetical protein